MRKLLLLMIMTLATVAAELLPGWAGTNPQSNQTIDHGRWQGLLDRYLKQDQFAQTYFAYAQVTPTDRQALADYISALERVDPLNLNAAEQKAYWINLYNAVTLATVLDAYPVDSIRAIGGPLGGLIPTGPWQLPVVTVNAQALSLDDIEHGIIRPKFNDHRIHYAVNCAAMGCPNLAKQAYTGENIERLLQQAEPNFINHPRGVRIQGGRLIVSKIFAWYQQDFVAREADLPAYFADFAEPKLRAQLIAYRGRIRYEYDWSLNDAR